MKKLWFVALFISYSMWAHIITVDGDDSDWIGTSPAVEDTFTYSEGEFIWRDAINDDKGDGGDALAASDNPSSYIYPTATNFRGTEADIKEIRITADESQNKLYFLIKIDYGEVWMPFVAICIDLDHIKGSGQVWLCDYGDLLLDSLNAWEYCIAVRNMKVDVYDANWTIIDSTSENYFKVDTLNGLIELGIDISKWSITPWNKNIFVTVCCGLNEDYNFREVAYSETAWTPGGGTDDWSDPDVFDIAFAKQTQQIADLSSYTDTTAAILSETSVATVDMTKITAVEENISEHYLKILRNINELLIESHKTKNTLKIYDVSGRLIENIELNNKIVRWKKDLPAGIYIFNLNGYSGKLIIMK